MNLDKLTKRSRVLKTQVGLKEVANALDEEFGLPGVTNLAMSILTNYRDTKDYVDTFHRYLYAIRTKRGTKSRWRSTFTYH